MPRGHLPAGVRLHLLGRTESGTGALLVEGLLRAQAGWEDAAVVHACVRCGSAQHGRLVASTRNPLWANVSRTDEATIVALRQDGPIGVDIESVVDFDGDLATLERWCAVEAALKAAGQGLAIDPDTVHLSAGCWSDRATLRLPDGSLFEVWPFCVDGVVARLAIPLRGSAAPAG